MTEGRDDGSDEKHPQSEALRRAYEAVASAPVLIGRDGAIVLMGANDNKRE